MSIQPTMILRFLEGVLNITPLDLGRNIFEQGANSLLVARLVGQLEQQKGIKLPIVAVFQSTTVTELIDRICRASVQTIETIRPAPPADDYALSPQQRRWWNIYLPERNRSWATMVRVIGLPQGADETLLKWAVTEIVAEQASLRLFFRQSPAELRQIMCEAEVRIDSMQNFRGMGSSAQAALGSFRQSVANQEIDPFVWPLFRCHYVLMPEGPVLVFAIHHMISDGISQDIFGRRLLELLRSSLVENAPAPAPAALTFSYLDYANWARAREATSLGPLGASRAYWHKVYAEPYSPIALEPRSTSGSLETGRAVCRPISVSLSDAIDIFCRTHGITPFSLFLATKFLTLHDWLKRDDLVIGTPANGRHVPGTEEIIGNFISLVTVRNRVVEQAEEFTDFVRAVMHNLAEAMQHQDYQYDRLIQDLGIPFNQNSFPLTTIFISSVTSEALRQQPFPDTEKGARALGNVVKFDIMSYLRTHANCISLDVQFREGLFSDEEIENLITHWVALISRKINFVENSS